MQKGDFLFVPGQNLQPGKQFWNLHCRRYPENLHIYVKVRVCQSIAHPGHGFPRNVQVGGANLILNLGCRVADDLYGPHQRELKHTIPHEFCTMPASNKLHGMLSRFDDVSNTNQIFSAQTAAPLYGLPHP